jgi:hypothetical protein
VISAGRQEMKINSQRDFHVTTKEFDMGILNLVIDGKAIKSIRVVDGAVDFPFRPGGMLWS